MDGETKAAYSAANSSMNEASTATGVQVTSRQDAVHRAVYFTFKDFLSREDQASFLDWPHQQQIAQVAKYLDFVAKQPAAANFTSSARASTSWAVRTASDCAVVAEEKAHGAMQTVVEELLDGRTKSGFGAFGSDEGFLPQKQLSLAVAHSVEQIGHEYIVDRNKKGELRPPVLNSRSFYVNWCHAEKQKLMDIRLKLNQHVGRDSQHWMQRRRYWEQVVVVVDRAMCADCIQYARSLAAHEQAHVTIQDPSKQRVFPPDKAQDIVTIDI